MDRKAIARETLRIMEQGYYERNGQRVDIDNLQKASIEKSFLLTPEEGEVLIKDCETINKQTEKKTVVLTLNCSTVDAILKLKDEGKQVAVLNFASAKNPGGGFRNGAMAQEESLAASSSLYETLLAHEDYYIINRACKTMVYTNHAIYSPDVPFFRDGRFRLMESLVLASVLTLPAVNMGQVKLKGEDVEEAEKAMRHRMKLALAIFAHQNCRHLVLGAYGCGVFRNDPEKIALWWKELLDNDFKNVFDTIFFAVLDRSATENCIRPFQSIFDDHR